jgi:hypothetical protein
MREMRSKYKTIIGKPEGKKRPLEIEMGMFRDSIEINLEKQGKGVDWVYMAQDKDQWQTFVNKIMNFRVP